MGKSGKKSKAAQRQRRLPLLAGKNGDGDGGYVLPSSAFDLPEDREKTGGGNKEDDEEEGGSGDGDGDVVEMQNAVGALSKFDLYQKSVQSPKGDISYLQKFFLTYVGGRRPLHLQEDFCGTALLSSEWLRSDPRRTAVGLDLDLEALNWCLENNIGKVGCDGYSRISLFHGNVLYPHKAGRVKPTVQDFMRIIDLNNQKDCFETAKLTTGADTSIQECSSMEEASLPPRDIICAFNYSCCCLQKRADLISYFKNALNALSKKGGIFVMDLYGGISSERKLKLQRKFSNFTYVWEQAEFDIISRRTRISLHFYLGKKWMIRHAFSYDWRLMRWMPSDCSLSDFDVFEPDALLGDFVNSCMHAALVTLLQIFQNQHPRNVIILLMWSLPEIKDCLEEAGFQSVHFWIRDMPNTEEDGHWEEYNSDSYVKYEELSSFRQQDAWNAYVVGVANL